MSEPLIIAVPSKGRLKEQVEEWLADCGLKLSVTGGARGYMAEIKGLAGAQVRLLSAGDIAEALDSGEVHLGVTGEDLLRERGGDLDSRALLLRPLGFGRADLVVAVPKSWLDVDSMADLEEVAHDVLARTGRRMRVATKYLMQTRSFFARHGVADYRITESSGATEGAPAAGAAELIVDITTTGATLVANGLKILGDGVILKSQAQLAASLRATWSDSQLSVAERLLRVIEARATAHDSATLVWPDSEGDEDLIGDLVAAGATRRPNGVLAPVDRIAAISTLLTAKGRGPVTASRPDFVFETSCGPYEALAQRVKN
ncbi:MAG: ATP phosphoribosyltransferase [Phenylobacterium sp.]|uniref:ATP phosphoribosyltransferase n=1 Tax=Phenylobacterium sp. TaxID=1871053 RepID=UPI001B5E71B5|nr:ATP phosphoribosyltransferase [Phenylobacterium sp.]MBP7816710.1 ATP phosphoribosyltransferase [Phenylobacterium sp.]MBP9756136.1 ATP phosphoribosyltransferase [Phenylobacterium sp.]